MYIRDALSVPFIASLLLEIDILFREIISAPVGGDFSVVSSINIFPNIVYKIKYL